MMVILLAGSGGKHVTLKKEMMVHTMGQEEVGGQDNESQAEEEDNKDNPVQGRSLK